MNGDRDSLVTVESVEKLVDKLKQQRGLDMALEIMPGADHFFTGCLDQLNEVIEGYLDRRLDEIAKMEQTHSGGRRAPKVRAVEAPDSADDDDDDDVGAPGNDGKIAANAR